MPLLQTEPPLEKNNWAERWFIPIQLFIRLSFAFGLSCCVVSVGASFFGGDAYYFIMGSIIFLISLVLWIFHKNHVIGYDKERRKLYDMVRCSRMGYWYVMIVCLMCFCGGATLVMVSMVYDDSNLNVIGLIIITTFFFHGALIQTISHSLDV